MRSGPIFHLFPRDPGKYAVQGPTKLSEDCRLRTVSRRWADLKIREIPFYCRFVIKCILSSLTFHILALGFVLMEQGSYICDLVSSGAKNSVADLVFKLKNISIKSIRYQHNIDSGIDPDV